MNNFENIWCFCISTLLPTTPFFTSICCSVVRLLWHIHTVRHWDRDRRRQMRVCVGVSLGSARTLYRTIHCNWSYIGFGAGQCDHTIIYTMSAESIYPPVQNTLPKIRNISLSFGNCVSKTLEIATSLTL